jgi:arabinogalactan endo-1,4-beta-galactosidase
MKTTLTAIILATICLRSFAAETTATNQNSRTGPFILGAEVSWAPEDEADGAVYYDHGVKKDIFQILKDYRFNYLRLRLFVNPASTNGYARRRAEAFCDLAHVQAMAKRARAAGMGLLLDIHYGDTWTSPGHQEKPVAWKDLNFAELTRAVHDFTFHAIKSLKDNGTPVNMVQLGNEISDGLRERGRSVGEDCPATSPGPEQRADAAVVGQPDSTRRPIRHHRHVLLRAGAGRRLEEQLR